MSVLFGGGIFSFLIMLFLIFAAGVSLLYNIVEAIDDFKEKRKLKKDNKN